MPRRPLKYYIHTKRNKCHAPYLLASFGLPLDPLGRPRLFFSFSLALAGGGDDDDGGISVALDFFLGVVATLTSFRFLLAFFVSPFASSFLLFDFLSLTGLVFLGDGAGDFGSLGGALFLGLLTASSDDELLLLVLLSSEESVDGLEDVSSTTALISCALDAFSAAGAFLALEDGGATAPPPSVLFAS